VTYVFFNGLASEPLAPTGAIFSGNAGKRPWPLVSFSFVEDTNRFLREIKPPSKVIFPSKPFGIPFKARHTPSEKSSTLVIWGTLGYLPYSVHSHQKRRGMISILEATRSLRNVKFGVDPHMKIIVTGSYRISKPPSPDYIFVPLVRFLEESMPFIRLIGDNL
jgi:hypothetical protein